MAENKIEKGNNPQNLTRRGRGRPKGSKNKIPAVLKEQILEAGAKAHPEGMVGYLTQQAHENPSAFLSLIGKVLPLTLESGPNGLIITTAERSAEF